MGVMLENCGIPNSFNFELTAFLLGKDSLHVEDKTMETSPFLLTSLTNFPQESLGINEDDYEDLQSLFEVYHK